STLPVQLISFSGLEKNRMAELQWSVEAEDGLSHYTVQRSKDGVGYEDIGKVNAKNSPGVLQYYYTDRMPYNGINYYRLSIHDIDGSKKFSNIVPVNVNIGAVYKVLLNPFHDKLQIAVENPSGQVISASLTDVSGKIVAQKNDIGPFNSLIQFDLPRLSAGMYFLKLFNGETVQVFKVMKR
ncbi:MAG TPA: T9SS type A sorting domain-containing protein, partial [Chitinophagaceae bacterium]|nr:T9SS type A sorting domain-containing protein [Chitinophagaceae bacterium]